MSEFSIEFGGETVRRSMGYEAGRTSFLLVDMQRIWAEPMMDPTHPHPADSYFMQRVHGTVIPNQVRILNAFRKAGENVLHTIIESLTRDGRDRSLDHKLSDIHVPKGAPEGQVIDELAPVANEIVLPKTSSSVFISTHIDYILRNLGVSQIVLCGCLTDQCVESAVRDACDLGYLVTLVPDACATMTQARHDTSLRAIKGYCRQVNTADLLREIGQ